MRLFVVRQIPFLTETQPANVANALGQLLVYLQVSLQALSQPKHGPANPATVRLVPGVQITVHFELGRPAELLGTHVAGKPVDVFVEQLVDV